VPPATDFETLRFGRFEIRPAERVLRVAGQEVSVGARAFDILLALAQRRGRLVTKQELLDLVWPGVVVEEHNIAAHISSLRKLLGAQAIATIPGRGYRFTASSDEGESAGAMPTPAASATHAPAAARTHLPLQLTPLLGRDEDVSALAGLLERHRIVTVVGAGGIGKSLLAQHLLRDLSDRYPHGACWVELADVSDPAVLPARIADALGVRPGTGEPLAGLCVAAASLTLLIALDNAEHLLVDVAHTVAALLDAAPGLRLIVTSQAPLRLAAEQIYRVGPLAVPQGPLPAALAQTFGAVALFVERARGADAHFVLSNESAPAAIELCQQLDGLPLAIELAAVRAPLLGVRQLAASMQNRLQLLTLNRDAGAPARQQTLRAALDWSCSFLGQSERTVFRRLGVIAHSASLPLIQQIVADEKGDLDAWAALDALAALVNRSLVTVLLDDDGEPRYRLLESPRLLALEQLDAAGERGILQRRHAHALAAAFDAAWDDRWSGRVGMDRWAARILLDASNARDAIAWARSVDDPEIAVTIAATLFMALPRWSHIERMELGDLCESLVERLELPQLRLRACIVAVRPFLHRSQQRSLVVAGNGLAVARSLDREAPDRWRLYQALCEWMRAAAIVTQPPLEALRAAAIELDALENSHWPPQRLVEGCASRRLARLPFDDPARPTEHLALTHRWLAAMEAAGADTAPCFGILIDAELECGHVRAAVAVGERTLAQLTGTRDEWSLLNVRVNLAMAQLAMDDTQRARPLLQASHPSALHFGLPALCSDYLALLAAIESRPRTAARLAGYADAAYAARGLFRHPNEVAARERTRALARAALDDATFDQLVADGQTLRAERAAALAFAKEDAA
jgi:predicted ATPase/DNA-binding winged helix-turn-helix (wHTH) protein